MISRWLLLWRGRIKACCKAEEGPLFSALIDFLYIHHIDSDDWDIGIKPNNIDHESTFNRILSLLEVKPNITLEDRDQVVIRYTPLPIASTSSVAPDTPLREATRQKLDRLEALIRELKRPKSWVVLCNLADIDSKTVKRHRPDLYKLWQKSRNKPRQEE